MAHSSESSTSQFGDGDLSGPDFNNLFNEEDIEQSQYFSNIVIQIEKDLAGIKAVHENINITREKVAYLEWQLLNKVTSWTWKDISELIGLSGAATVIHECFRILDHADQDKS